MRTDRGFSLLELVVVLAFAALLMMAGVVFALDWYGRERIRSSVYVIQSNLQLTRFTAVQRHRPCRFMINVSSRRIRVIDLNNPTVSSDDKIVTEMTLPPNITFERPDVGSPVTLHHVSGAVYDATLQGDGSVSEGVGDLILHAGGAYMRLRLFAAGGVVIERWNGAAWTKT